MRAPGARGNLPARRRKRRGLWGLPASRRGDGQSALSIFSRAWLALSMPCSRAYRSTAAYWPGVKHTGIERRSMGRRPAL